VGCFLYEADTGRLVGGSADESTFGAVLPLCAECTSAAIGQQATVENATSAAGPPIPPAVLRPDRDLSFTLTDSSPLRYERRSVDVGGTPTDLVLAVAGNSRGRATIDHFALNTRFAVEPVGLTVGSDGVLPGAERIELPPGGSLAWPDPRLRLRTRAWNAAGRLAPLLAEEDPVAVSAFMQQARTAITYTGFWSVWATVLADAHLRHELVARLLLPPRRDAATSRLAAGSTWAAGAELTGHAGDHPGTRTDWLPPEWLARLTSGGAR